MTDDLMDQLLHEGESSRLDYKRDQYVFSGASDDEKSELLKDIMAFANSWRDSQAFILIGIEEVQGARCKVAGVATHLADHQLQQFVNQKTNRHTFFSYHAYPFEGKQVGIIAIEQQERPVYVTKDYGKVSKDRVYYRQGSSTAIASPAEIARMGMHAEITKLVTRSSETAKKGESGATAGSSADGLTVEGMSSGSNERISPRAYVDLGQFLWFLCNPPPTSGSKVFKTIKGFLELLDRCELVDTKATARPLESLRLEEYVKTGRITPDSQAALMDVMQIVKSSLEHELKDRECVRE